MAELDDSKLDQSVKHLPATYQLNVDTQQLEQILGKLSKQRNARINWDNIAKITQVLGALAAGCWVIFQYLTFQSRSNEISLQQQQLQTRAAQASLTEVTIRREDLEKSIQLKRQETELKAAELEVLQLSKQVQVAQADDRKTELKQSLELKQLEIQASRLNEEKQRLDIDAITNNRFQDTVTITPTYKRTLNEQFSLFEVNYHIDLKNLSTQTLEVTLWVLDYYIGTLPTDIQRPQAFIAPLGLPPVRWGRGQVLGIREWKKLGSQGFKTESIRNTLAFPNILDVSFSDPVMTGVMNPDQLYFFSQTYLVQAPKDASIGFVASLCFNGCQKDADLWTRRDVEVLPQPSSSDGVQGAKGAKP